METGQPCNDYAWVNKNFLGAFKKPKKKKSNIPRKERKRLRSLKCKIKKK